MKILSVDDISFSKYGKVLKNYDLSNILSELSGKEKPQNVIYVASDKQLEATNIASQIRDNFYGAMPIQIGYCNGHNTKLNCLEYHRDSEINIVEGDTIFLVAQQKDIQNNKISTKKVEAFVVKARSAIEIYATTLHYAPCDAKKGEGFRVAVVLPRGTNDEKRKINIIEDEDRLLWATNKWLIAHELSDEGKSGAFIGLTDENIDIGGLI